MPTIRTPTMEALLLLSTLITSTEAFHLHPTTTNSITALTRPTSVTTLPALIYGWDGQDEEIDTAGTASTASTSSYLDIGNTLPDQKDCSPTGMAVAEALSYNRDKAGHLARLAVAFSPPEQALSLDVIENVEVICVHDDSIDIQAILCQEGGCVSLSIPIQFPKACHGHTDAHSGLEGCVLQNLEELDTTSVNLLQVQQQANSFGIGHEDYGNFHAPFESLPSWWLPPEYYQPDLLHDCGTVKQLLNEAEFQPDVQALAQDALTKQHFNYQVLQTRVAAVGPAGMCFKVRAQDQELGGTIHILEVVHKFDQPMTDGKSLRAAVLGAVASAEGN